ncbi:MAG: Yip1 family protein [Candidatus Woesearchaeota archaeon]
MPAPKTPKPPKMVNVKDNDIVYTTNYWSQLKLLLFKPLQFFESVKYESEYINIVIKYVVFFLILRAVLFIVGLYSDIREGGLVIIGVSLLTIILGALFGFIIPFINSAIIHIGVLLFGGKQGFFNTFKLVTYSLFIGLIYSTIATLIFEILNIFIPTEAITDITLMLPQLIISGAVGLIGLVHMIYTMVIGISYYHEMPKVRSFLAVIVIPAILIIFVTFISVIIMLMLYSTI